MADLHGQIKRGIAWVGVASGLVGALDAITNVVCLWLWVSPADLGTATMASALFPVFDRLAQLGLGQAAVRCEPERRALSSIMWLALASSLAVFGGSLIAAPWIGRLFDHPIVGSLLAAYALKLVVQTGHVVPEALLRKELAFGKLSIVRIVAMLADSLVKLGVAYLGAHEYPDLKIWCFVAGPIANGIVTTVGLQICHPWLPAFVFDARAAFAALRFGAQIAFGELLYWIYVSMDYVVIGRVFGDAAVGAYRLAFELVLDVVRLVSMVTAEVAFAAFARIGRDRAASGELLVRFTRQNLVAIAPILVVIGVAADDLLAMLYPPLGPAAATAARILCVVGALRAASFVLPPMLAGLGHARDGLIYNAVAAVLLPASFVIAAWALPELGYLSVAWAWAVAYPLAFALLLELALVRTGLTLGAYARGIARVVACSAVATGAALGARWVLPADATLRGIGTSIATGAVYLAMIKLTAADRK